MPSRRAKYVPPAAPPEAKLLAERIQKLRKKRSLTQEQLAEAAELDRAYIAGIEAGLRNPALRNLAKIARALRVTLADLFTE